MGIAWVVVGFVMAAVVVAVALYIVSGANASTGKLSVLIVLAKIAITLIQILTQLESPLQLQWPGDFAWFVNLLKVFSFDMLGFINIGCVTAYSYYEKFLFAFFMMPALLAIVGVVFFFRKSVDGIQNRCIQMALTSIFLSYPFVSQTMFQGFSCRQLDVNESYLDVGEIQLPIPALLFVKIDN